MKKFLFDLFPLILFFIVYRFAGIYWATGTSIVAALLQLAWLKVSGRKIEVMLWVNVGIIVVFGGATLVLHNDAFIKCKPTILYGLFGVALLGGQLMGRNILRHLLGSQIQMPDAAWKRMNVSWAVFFLLAGVLNLYVAFSGHYTESQWVTFHSFGLTILTVIFVVGQSFWLGRHMQSVDAPSPAADDPSSRKASQ